MLRCDVNIPSNRKDLYSMPQKGFPIPRQKLDWDISSQMRMLIKKNLILRIHFRKNKNKILKVVS